MTRRAGAVEERPVRLQVNGRTVAAWTASPGEGEALAAGRLLTDGIVGARSDIRALHVRESGDVVMLDVEVLPALAVNAVAGAEPADWSASFPPHVRAPLPPLDSFPGLFRELFALAEGYSDVGGLHSAALSDGERVLHHVEEIGRHNAVDKVIGLALLAGDDIARLGLVISARVSGDMARKCARAGVAWIASRSVPTTLAVSVAERAGMPILSRAAGKDAYIMGGG